MKYKSLVAALFAALLLSISVFAQSAIPGTVVKNANLRAGPGTSYTIVGTVTQGQSVTIVEENSAGDWYHLDNDSWIATFLVNVTDTITSTIAPSLTPTLSADTSQPVSVSPISTPIATAMPTPVPPTATPQVLPTANPQAGQRYGAICRDGTQSTATGRGACSHHGGVDHWLVH